MPKYVMGRKVIGYSSAFMFPQETLHSVLRSLQFVRGAQNVLRATALEES